MQISLRAARVNADMTQEDIAKHLNVNKATIINWEKGKSAPSASQFKVMCDVYGMPMDNIFFASKVR